MIIKFINYMVIGFVGVIVGIAAITAFCMLAVSAVTYMGNTFGTGVGMITTMVIGVSPVVIGLAWTCAKESLTKK